MVLAVFPRLNHGLLGVLLGLWLLAGCGGRKEQFVGARTLDRCNESWPVCDSFAGCLIGPQSYTTGRFPGDGRFIVQVFEPSIARVSFYLENVTSAGTETWIRFYEDRCRANVKVSIDGRAFVGESERIGQVDRQVELSGLGDHLIEFKSDGEMEYTIKADVIPKRLAGSIE
jgi:hypothetical protein